MTLHALTIAATFPLSIRLLADRRAPPSEGSPKALRWLSGLVVILALSVPYSVWAAESRVSITSVIQLETRVEEAPTSSDALVLMTQGAGQIIPSLEAATYTPFKSQWFVIRLSRPEPAGQSEYFRIASLQRREIDAFLIVDGKIVSRAFGGYSRVDPSAALESPDFKLPLNAWTGTEATLLLRTVTSERLPFLASVRASESAQRAATLANSFLFFFIGSSLVFIAFQILFYVGLRERASRDYAVFVSLIFLVHVVRGGYLSWDIWVGREAIYPGDLLFFLRLAVPLAGLRMLSSFLDLALWSPVLHRWNRRLQALLLGSSLLALFLGSAAFQTTVVVWHLPVCVWVVAVTARACVAKRPGARLLLVAWSGLSTASVYTNLVISGWLAPSFFLPYAAPLGILWEMAFNGTGLAVRLESLREQRHQAQVRKIEVQELARLVQIVCHDISNPLMVVRFALERMKNLVQSGEAPVALAEPILQARQGEQAIKGIIEDVHALEVLRNSGDALPVSAVNVNRLAREALAMFRERAVAKGVQIDDQLPEQEILATAAPGILVRNVLANLLSNALKYSPTGTRVTLAVQRRPGQIGLSITDCGEGIPAETIAALERAEPLTSQLGTAGERGTGFGLRITRDFVVAMGGTLHFAAPKPGVGTTVTIWLREA